MTPIDKLLTTARELGADELEVLIAIAERLYLGQRCYGRFDLSTDRRDFEKEMFEECADGMVYAAAAIIRRKRALNPGVKSAEPEPEPEPERPVGRLPDGTELRFF